MTFSIVGHCPRTDMAGVAITTSSICVGSRCPHVLAGAGAVTTQNVTDPSIGNEMLDLRAQGADAPVALAAQLERKLDDFKGRVAELQKLERERAQLDPLGC